MTLLKLSVSCTLLVASAAAGQAPTPSQLKHVDSLAAAEFAKDSLASLTVGVVTAEGLVWTKSYGFTDMASRALANRQTVYRIGSITKMFTALMLHQAVAAGKIRLSDPVERYYPEIREVRGYKQQPAPITVGQLATMTSGLAREPEEEGPFWTGPVATWDSTLRLAISHTRMDHAPGGAFLYSNIGYAILGATVSRAVGVPYVQWQKQHVLAPLGMSHTAFEIEPSIAPNVPRGYDIDRSGVADPAQSVRESITGRGYKVPNGAIYTTVDDLSRFLVLQLGRGPESVVPRARLDSAYRGVLDATGKLNAEYGIGFTIEQLGDRTIFGHGGAVAGFGAVIEYDRDHPLGVIILRNALGGRTNPTRLVRGIFEALSHP